MISLFCKKLIRCTITSLCLVLLVGCSSTTKPISTSVNSNKSNNDAATTAKAKPDATSVAPKVSQSENKSDKTNTLKSEIVTNTYVNKNVNSNTAKQVSKQEYKTKLDNIEIGLKVLDKKNSGTTLEMRSAADEKYKSWDSALNEIYNVLKSHLSSNDIKKLQSEEIQWISNRDATAKKASSEMKGGTMELVLYSISLADTTKKRCYELVEKYMQ